jgi:hypothetical protein
MSQKIFHNAIKIIQEWEWIFWVILKEIKVYLVEFQNGRRRIINNVKLFFRLAYKCNKVIIKEFNLQIIWFQ